MADQQAQPSGPDLSQGVTLSDFSGEILLGHVGDEDVLLARSGAEIFAIDAHCSHYHGPLAEGLVVGESVRCPWHHACFDLRTGEASRAPALNALSVWKVEHEGDRIFVREKGRQLKPRVKGVIDALGRIVIVGGGAAGFAAAEMLRRQNYRGSIVMLSGETTAPVDRPNLSKDYLAGSAPEDWLPLRPDDFYSDAAIDLRLKTKVASIDPAGRQVVLADGRAVPYDRLLLATGAEPVRLLIPGADQPHVHLLRSLDDCRAIIASASGARRAVVIGASFIGLEVAASLRARDIEVHVVGLEQRPMERVLGPEMGDFVRSLHEEHGVVFHLGDTVIAIDGKRASLQSGGVLNADLVVIGVGVRPRVALAEKAGLAIDRGVTVNAYLETSHPGIYAAGDIARWPDRHSGENIRVEHWVVAERQGQTAARNMLGQREVFDAVPFFWSQHYDVPINYVGHAEKWDEIEVDGDIAAKDCVVRYRRNGRVLAVASIYRDIASLEAELAMERGALAA
ncbi:FAD-dependent oxidoreductase [Bradyrhizobium sp. BRP22]|uniref:FAD-dependent oxidoreductase n=1 Tax=Bradyrhizobium sp. BRP22 TaxID=2793821 RepID=UPI001CD70E40|nr:FAD-dependent oxidoreductase [Bradyrhizobium sp. BRP22]MCA1454722.1 FAD-dependent oxidoreductase [Bradyrhizobium sp. BRP22]